ncbi:MAG: EncA/B family entericidin [Rhizobiales bacterium]|nr:EncA/B family entericidin [Hyphomicrobiales bacterium]MBA67768.1 EncA/B family entericidin [Hyphomicrobiales bacterium]|tara:strand:- start:1343 stop:1471 length:129 start_codon:yes stop_codon:yes gene_type:complete
MKYVKIAGVLALMLSLVACANTIRGVGRDVDESAAAVDDAVS